MCSVDGRGKGNDISAGPGVVFDTVANEIRGRRHKQDESRRPYTPGHWSHRPYISVSLAFLGIQGSTSMQSASHCLSSHLFTFYLPLLSVILYHTLIPTGSSSSAFGWNFIEKKTYFDALMVLK